MPVFVSGEGDKWQEKNKYEYARPPSTDMKLRISKRGLPPGAKTRLTKKQADGLKKQGWQIGSSSERMWGLYAIPPGSQIDRTAEAVANRLVQQSGGKEGLWDLINKDPYGVELNLAMRDAGAYSSPGMSFAPVSRSSMEYTQPPSGYSPSPAIRGLYPQGYSPSYRSVAPLSTGNKGRAYPNDVSPVTYTQPPVGQPILNVPPEIQPLTVPSRQQELAPALGVTPNDIRQEMGRRLARGDADYMLSGGRTGQPSQMNTGGNK